MVNQAGKIPIGSDGVEGHVFRPDNDTTDPDFIIPQEDIQQLNLPRSLGPLKDQGKLQLYNGHARYGSTPAAPGDGLTDGDRVDVYADLGGSSGMSRRFTGIVSNPSGEGTGANEVESTYSCNLEDFCGWVMSERAIEAGFEERQISGDTTSVLNYILREKCPEIDRSELATIPRTVTTKFNGTNVFKAVRTLVARSEGDMLLRSDHTTLRVRDLSDLITKHELADGDYGTYSWAENSDRLSNYVRLDGGKAEANMNKVTSGVGWENVAGNSRIMVQIDVPKSQVSSIEVYTDPTRTGSGAGLRVRIQKDEGGAPIDPSDKTIDEDHRTLAAPFLEHDGFTRYNFGNNDIIQDNPWLIIEVNDEGDGSGQDVRVNNVGNPLRIIRYPYPVSTRKSDPASIDNYRLREQQVSDNSITSLTEIGEAARALLADRNTVRRTVEFDARSDRAYELSPMDVVDVPLGVFRTAGFRGEYVVVERIDEYSGTSLDTTIKLQDRKTL
jgi:hypothetical protein